MRYVAINIAFFMCWRPQSDFLQSRPQGCLQWKSLNMDLRMLLCWFAGLFWLAILLATSKDVIFDRLFAVDTSRNRTLVELGLGPLEEPKSRF